MEQEAEGRESEGDAAKEAEEMNRNFNLTRSEMEREILEWIWKPRDREIVRLRLIEQLSFPEIAERVFLSERHTKRIYYRESANLFKHL